MSGAILRRELLGALRTVRTLALLVGLTAGFSLIVLLRWPTDGRVDVSGARSLQVFQVFAYTLLAGVLFVVPAFPATSFVREKNRGTLALLLNSPMTPAAIYWGKFGGATIFSLLILLASLPAAAACYSMGGVDLITQAGLLYLLLAACVVQYSTLALLVSLRVQSTDAGVRLTYALVFASSVLAIGPHWMLQTKAGTLASLSWWLRAASPIPALMETIGHGGVGVSTTPPASTIPAFFVIAAASSVVCALLTVAGLNHRLFDRARSRGRITQERSQLGRIVRRLVFLIDPQRRKSGIPFYINPVMAKEFRIRRFGRIHWLLRLVAVCAVLSLLLAFAGTLGVIDLGVERIGGFMVLLQMALIVLIVPSLTSGLISSERETGGWELLRMTPMSPFKILRGKLFSVIWTVALILLATLPGYLVMIYIKPAMWLQVRLVLGCLGLAAVYTVLIGAAVGSLFRKTASATIGCYVVLILLFLGPLLIWLGRDAPFSYRFVESALALNPTGAALSVIETPGFADFHLIPLGWWVSGTLTLAALLLLCGQVWRITRPV